MLQTMCGIFHETAAVYRDGNSAQVLASIAGHIDDYRQIGGECLVPHFFTLYALACARLGLPDLGNSAVNQACTLIERNDERWCEAELHRAAAALLLLDEDSATREVARTELDTALRIALQQHALLPALRAASDIVRLTVDSDHAEREQEVLGGILAQFTEGFDYVDVVRARALLVK